MEISCLPEGVVLIQKKIITELSTEEEAALFDPPCYRT